MSDTRLDDYPALPGDWEAGVDQYAPSPEQIETALDWLLKLREREVTDMPDYEAWQARHPAHLFAAAEARALFAAMAQPAKEASRHYRRTWQLREAVRRSGRGLRIAALAVAASLALFLAFPALQGLQDIGADAATAAGERRTLRLADGSRIMLNSRSAIDLDLQPRTRHARLLHGEAYFEIARDHARPFTIVAGAASVRVLGTRFNIRIDQDQVMVSVTQGRVLAWPTGRPGAAIAVTPGQQALIDRDSAQAQAIDPFEVTAWRRGEIMAYRTPLRIVVRDLNRYRAAPIYIVNGALVNNKVTGLFRADNPDDTIATIERTLGLESLTLPTGQTFLY